MAEYECEREGEELEHVGEHLALLDDGGDSVATVEVTAAGVLRFADVDWAFAQSEGEGFTSIEHWRQAHADSSRPLACPPTKLLDRLHLVPAGALS